MNITDQIKLSCPLHIAKLYEAMTLENEPRQRVHKLVELFEGIVRYLGLIGLASYIYYKLSDDRVEKIRAELERPSLGSWVSLLRTLDVRLRQEKKIFLLSTPANKTRQNDSIVEAFLILSRTIDINQPKKVNLIHFLDSIVEFRNKIAHETLSRYEAKQVLSHLESAIIQWMTELSILQHHALVYIDRVEWRAQHFLCLVTNLNTGHSLSPFTLERDEPVTGEQVHLYQPINGNLIPLHPFFFFNNDTHLLYIYTRLSDKRELTLRCPYEISGEAEPTYSMSYDESIITGVKPISLTEEEKLSDSLEEKKLPEFLEKERFSDHIQEEKSSALSEMEERLSEPIEEEKSFESDQDEKPSVPVEEEKLSKPTEEEKLSHHIEEAEQYRKPSLSPQEKENVDKYANEIKQFFARMPRFNVVVVKSKQSVSLEYLAEEIEFQLVDLKNSVIEGEINLEEITGYTELLKTLNRMCDEVKKQGIVFSHIDLLLSALDRSKRKYFFERLLQKTFPRPSIFSTVIFGDEIPDVKHQEFSYAKVIE